MSTNQEQVQGGETSSANQLSVRELLDEYNSVSVQIETTEDDIDPAVRAERAKIVEAQQKIEEITAPFTALKERQKELRGQIAQTAFAEIDGQAELSVDPIAAWLLRNSANNRPEQVRQWADKIGALNERIAAGPLPFIYIRNNCPKVGLFEGPVEPDRGRFPNDSKALVSHVTTRATTDNTVSVTHDPQRGESLNLMLPHILNCKTSAEDIEEATGLFDTDGLIVGEEALRTYFEKVAAYYTEHPALTSDEHKVFDLWLTLKNTGVDCTDLLPEGQSLEKFQQTARDRLAHYIENWISPYSEGRLSSSLVQMVKLTGITAPQARYEFESVVHVKDNLSNRDRAKWRELFEIDLKYEFELTDETK